LPTWRLLSLTKTLLLLGLEVVEEPLLSSWSDVPSTWIPLEKLLAWISD